jgi:hypothetical protein
MSKYNNKVIYYDIQTQQVVTHRPPGALCNPVVCFDSKWEFECYRVINEYFRSLYIDIHFPIQLKGISEFSSGIIYYCDFRIAVADGEYLYVEAKGVMTAVALLKLKLLEIVDSKIRNNLIIVSEIPQNYFGTHYPASYGINDLRNRLRRLCQKK